MSPEFLFAKSGDSVNDKVAITVIVIIVIVIFNVEIVERLMEYQAKCFLTYKYLLKLKRVQALRTLKNQHFQG